MSHGPGPQRRFSRVPAECPVLVRFLDADEAQRYSRTQVVGLGGCSFIHPRALEPGTGVRLDIGVGEGLVEAEGRVVYSKSEGAWFEVGVEFLRITPGARARLATLFQKLPPQP